jgi:uncharacterized protein YijF (DUF1287 family)
MIRALIAALIVTACSAAFAAPSAWQNEALPWEIRVGAAAEERARHRVVYDGSGMEIPYPMGDVPPDRGVCTDEVVRVFRMVGVDLQRLVHEDMMRAFFEYPQKFGETRPNTNIDHRRVGNLQTFFERNATVVPVTQDGANYRPGDIVVWDLDNGQLHIGMVTRRRSKDGKRPLVMHNIAHGPKINDQLFYFPVLGHYRFDGTVKHTGPFLRATMFARPREKPQMPEQPAP